MNTFIRAAEVWVPGRDRQTLEFSAGMYGAASRFGALSRQMCFGRGEGLPGRAWAEGRPVMLRSFEGSYFKRTAAAQADGLTAAIALPIFAGDYLSAVLVIFCADDAEHAGAIELWRNEPPSADMKLADAYYGRTGDTFETVSRHLSLRRGTGLPGLAWQHEAPVFMADLGRAAGFLRADSAQRVGINRGFAFPCSLPGAEVWVMAFLSALGTPIVRRFEVWEPDAARATLVRNGGYCEQAGMLEGDAPMTLDFGQGSIGQAASTGVPALNDNLVGEPVVAAGALAAGLQSLLAIPVLRNGRLVSVVAWYF